MNMRAAGSRKAGLSPVTDKRIGDAYPIIEAVYRELHKLKFIADNAENLVARQIYLRGNNELRAIEWRHGDQEWMTLITYGDITGGLDIAFLEELSNDVINAAAEIKEYQGVQTKYIATGDQVRFSLGDFSYEPETILIKVGGVLVPEDQYMIQGNEVVFATAPAFEEEVEILVAPKINTLVHAANVLLPTPHHGTWTLEQYVKESPQITQPSGNDPLGGFDSYAKVRAYQGGATRMQVKDPTGVHWWTQRGSAEDNGGTVLVDAKGRRWEREYAGPASPRWFSELNTDGTYYAALQAALNHCSFVQLDDGHEFNIGEGRIVMPDRSLLVGTRNSLLKATCATRTNPNEDHIIVMGNNCGAIGFAFDSGRNTAVQEIRSFYVGGGVNNVRIQDIYFDNFAAQVWVGHASNVSILNNYAAQDYINKGGVILAGEGPSGYASDIFITGNHFGAVTEEAIDINGFCRNVLIAGNRFYSSHTGPDVDGTECIDIGSNSDCYSITIANNEFHGNGFADAFVWVKQGSYSINIEGNYMNGLRAEGWGAVRISNSRAVMIKNNIIRNVPRALMLHERSSTVQTDGVMFSGNDARNIDKEAVQVAVHTASVLNLVIQDNVLECASYSGRGLDLFKCSSPKIINNVIGGVADRVINIDNTSVGAVVCGNAIEGGAVGVHASAINSKVSNNTINAAITHGIVINAANCEIANNVASGCGASGLAVSDANNAIITGNRLTGNSQFGIFTATDCTDVICVNNFLKGNTSGAISSSGTRFVGASLVENIT